MLSESHMDSHMLSTYMLSRDSLKFILLPFFPIASHSSSHEATYTALTSPSDYKLPLVANHQSHRDLLRFPSRPSSDIPTHCD